MIDDSREYVLYNPLPPPPVRKMIKFWISLYGEYLPDNQVAELSIRTNSISGRKKIIEVVKVAVEVEMLLTSYRDVWIWCHESNLFWMLRESEY